MSTDIHKLQVEKDACLNDLFFFTRYFFKKQTGKKYIQDDHLKLIANKLQQVIEGKITRLIINIAPRYGKTELAVKHFVAYCLALNASARFIHLSYSDDLALDNSETIRDLVMSEDYQRFFDVRIKKDSKSKKKWYTQSRGGVYATSAAGQVTGFGAGQVDYSGENNMIDEMDSGNFDEFASYIEQIKDFGGAIIIDDPIKPDSADRPKERDRVNYRFDSTIENRVNSRKTPIIIIMQRVHPEDLCGYLVDRRPEEWDTLILPVIKEDGEALCARIHTINELEKKKEDNEVVFERQYMQDPKPLKGLLFPRQSLNYFTMQEFGALHIESKLGAIDPADSGTDHLSFPIGEMSGTNIYITDVMFTLDEIETTKPIIILKINDLKLNHVYIETNSHGKPLGVDIRNECPLTTSFFKYSVAHKPTRMINQAGFIKKYFHFRSDIKPNTEYGRFMKELTSWMKDESIKDDDAPDSVCMLSWFIQTLMPHVYKVK